MHSTASSRPSITRAHLPRRSSLRWLLLVGSLLLLGIHLPDVQALAVPAYTWSNGASAPLARFEAQGLVVNGKLYLMGGFYDTELHATKRMDVYDIATNAWRRIADLPEPLTHAGQTVDGNTIYLVGGYVGNNPGPSTNHVWKYNIGSNTWSAGPALPASRGGGAVVVLDHKLHFFGGATRRQGSKSSTVDQSEHFVLDLNGGTQWTNAASLPNPRNHLGAAALNGKAYVLGGQHVYKEGTTSQKQVDVYNPATDSWTRAADLPGGRSHISASTFVMEGHLIVIGGSVNNGSSGATTTEVATYDPRTNDWSQLPALPAGRKTPVAGTDGTHIVVTTGGRASATSTTWRATPQQLSASASQEPWATDNVTPTSIATNTATATPSSTATASPTMTVVLRAISSVQAAPYFVVPAASFTQVQIDVNQEQAFLCDLSDPADGGAARSNW